MKILTGIDLPFSPSCGSMILCDNLYSDLPKNIEVKFLALDSAEGTTWSSIKDVELFKIHKYTSEKYYENYIKALKKEVIKVIKKFKPDIIHIQHLTFGLALVFRSIDIPKIAICHGTDVLIAKEHTFHRESMLKVIAAVQCVIFPTISMYKDCIKISNNIPNYKIIYWGIPDSAFKKRAEKKPPRKVFKLLYAGRLTHDKGVEDIIKALNLINDAHVSLSIVGGGPILSLLKKKVKQYNLNKKIKFINFLNREELWKLFPKYDLLIVSSKFVEAFCLTALEALAHGLPVLCSDIGGTKEIIHDKRFIFEANNVASLSQKIKFFKNNRYQLNEVNQKNIQRLKKFTISNTKNKIWDLSKKTLINS